MPTMLAHPDLRPPSAGLSSLGVPGVPWHTQILADQLTLFQPEGTDYAHLITIGTPGFSDLPTALLRTKLCQMPTYKGNRDQDTKFQISHWISKWTHVQSLICNLSYLLLEKTNVTSVDFFFLELYWNLIYHPLSSGDFLISSSFHPLSLLLQVFVYNSEILSENRF